MTMALAVNITAPVGDNSHVPHAHCVGPGNQCQRIHIAINDPNQMTNLITSQMVR